VQILETFKNVLAIRTACAIGELGDLMTPRLEVAI
jgi:hypothetical protein